MTKWLWDLIDILLCRRVVFVAISTASLLTSYEIFYIPGAGKAFFIVAVLQVTLLLVLGSNMQQDHTHYKMAVFFDGLHTNLSKILKLQNEKISLLRQTIIKQDQKIKLLEDQLNNNNTLS